MSSYVSKCLNSCAVYNYVYGIFLFFSINKSAALSVSGCLYLTSFMIKYIPVISLQDIVSVNKMLICNVLYFSFYAFCYDCRHFQGCMIKFPPFPEIWQ